MPIRSKAMEVGNFSPGELALLARVFERTKPASETDQQRDSRASRIIANYMAGIRDEDELAALSKQALRR